VIDIADQNPSDLAARKESDLDRQRRFDFIYRSHVWVRHTLNFFLDRTALCHLPVFFLVLVEALS